MFLHLWRNRVHERNGCSDSEEARLFCLASFVRIVIFVLYKCIFFLHFHSASHVFMIRIVGSECYFFFEQAFASRGKRVCTYYLSRKRI